MSDKTIPVYPDKSSDAVWHPRRKTHAVKIQNGHVTVTVGGGAPVVVQSMTNTATEDVAATVAQVKALSRAGSELVRVTVNTPQAALAVPEIRAQLDAEGFFVPLVGDFHYNGHKLLTDYPACAAALSKYRINPGNVGKGAKHDDNFATMIRIAADNGKAVRIGVNGGSLDKELLSQLMEANRASAQPRTVRAVTLDAIVKSAHQSALKAVELGLPADCIVLSTKVSDVQDLVSVCRSLSALAPWALHLGLTEAGGGTKGVVASSAALSVLLSEGIGDTIRISITPAPGKAREEEVYVAQELLQSMGLRHFSPLVVSCPGCGRTSSDLFQKLAAQTQEFLRERTPEWRRTAPGFESMTVAVMGCVVNGPGESGNADIGISLPGRGESPVAPVYCDGVKKASLKGDDIMNEFKAMIDAYVAERWGSAS